MLRATDAAALCVFLVTFFAYVLWLCPGPYWLDSSEFAVASFVLGIAHPPGHPLALLLGKAVSLVPLGPIAFRVGLSQALCGAGAAAVMTRLCARLCARVRRDVFVEESCRAPRAELLAAILGAAAALCTSLGYAAAFQAVRPEVYALNRLLSLLALLFLLRHDESADPRDLALCALFLGLGLANHHFLTLLVLLPVPLLLFPAPPQGSALRNRAVVLSLGAGAAGLLLYVYLPLRAAHHPLVNWGSPTSLQRIFWVVSAQAFQKSVKPPQAGDADVVGAVVDALHPVGTVLALTGLYLLLRKRRTWRLGAYLLAAAGLLAGGRAVLGFDVANPDAYGYLVPGIDVLALCAGAGAAGLICLLQTRRHLRFWKAAAGALPPPGRGAMALAVLLLVGGTLWALTGAPRTDRRGFWDLDVLCGDWLREAPPRAWLVSNYFQTVFALWYLQGVEGLRPDVLHVHPHFLPNPGYRQDLSRRFRDTPALLSALGEQALQKNPLLRASQEHPVLWEYDLDAPPWIVPFLYARGLNLSVETRPDPLVLMQRAREAQLVRDEKSALVDLGEPETRRVVLWRSFLAMTLSCQRRDRATFVDELLRARSLLKGGGSAEIDLLERTCR